MKSEDDRNIMAIINKNDGNIETTGEWNAMGVRGTQSIPMVFDVQVPHSRIINENIQEINTAVMIPVGHLGWSAAWYRAAKGAFDRVMVSLCAKKDARLKSDLLMYQLARIRASLDMLEALITKNAIQVDHLISAKSGPKEFFNNTLVISLNNMKISASEFTSDDKSMLKPTKAIKNTFKNSKQTTINNKTQEAKRETLNPEKLSQQKLKPLLVFSNKELDIKKTIINIRATI